MYVLLSQSLKMNLRFSNYEKFITYKCNMQRKMLYIPETYKTVMEQWATIQFLKPL
jgi:hypothetical protein